MLLVWNGNTGPFSSQTCCLKWYQSNSFHNALTESIALSSSLAGTLRRPAGTLTQSGGTPYRLMPAHFYHWMS